MPLSHRKLAAWYVQLAQQLEAGLPLAEALQSSRGTGAPSAGLEAMAAQITRGGSVDDALRAGHPWLPIADKLALSASAEAGRLPLTLRNLSTRHEQIGAAKRRVVAACVYPLGVLHVGLLLAPLTRMIDWEKGFFWSAAAYARGVAWGLLPLWAIIVTLVVLARRHHPLLTHLARLMPALRGYTRAQALADFSFALGNFLSAGVPIGKAWATAGLISHSADLKAAAAAMEQTVNAGEPPGLKLASWPCFPPDFTALYRTGEKTGQLEANLSRLTTQNQEEANRSLARATFIYPAFLFLIVAGGVVYFVVTFYAGYLKMISGLAG
ncbi:MAG: type II secretion system F family protein [Opitutaceae bacterium]